MNRKIIYFSLSIAGLVIPYFYFIKFLLQFGLDPLLLMQQLFSNNISAFFGVDVLISGVVFLFFLFSEGKKYKIKYLWIYVICLCLAGVSFALPLFLFAREVKKTS